MKAELEKLGDIVIVSGGTKERILSQIDGLKCDILAQSGNEAPGWYNKLSPSEVKEIYKHIESLKEYWEPYNEHVQLIQNRDCQISLSLMGHDAPTDAKKRFDPDRIFRRWLLTAIPFKSKKLRCAIGGSTCLDYTKGSKGDNIARYIKEKGLNPDDCVYYGDSLFSGGNDESVIGVIPVIAVKNPEEMLALLKL